MNPGIVEETGKAVQLVIKTLDTVPVLLALVLLQFFILGGVLYINLERESNFHIRSLALIERCIPLGQPHALKGTPLKGAKRYTMGQNSILQGIS